MSANKRFAATAVGLITVSLTVCALTTPPADDFPTALPALAQAGPGGGFGPGPGGFGPGPGGFGPGGGGPGGFGPGGGPAWRGGNPFDDVKARIQASDEEWKVIGPKLMKLVMMRPIIEGDTGFMAFGFGPGFGRGGPGGPGGRTGGPGRAGGPGGGPPGPGGPGGPFGGGGAFRGPSGGVNDPREMGGPGGGPGGPGGPWGGGFGRRGNDPATTRPATTAPANDGFVPRPPGAPAAPGVAGAPGAPAGDMGPRDFGPGGGPPFGGPGGGPDGGRFGPGGPGGRPPGGPGGGRGGPGGFGGPPPGGPGFPGFGSDLAPLTQAQTDLVTALDDPKASPETIKEKLQALRQAREKGRAVLAAAQKDLLELLTSDQALVLTALGYLD